MPESDSLKAGSGEGRRWAVLICDPCGQHINACECDWNEMGLGQGEEPPSSWVEVIEAAAIEKEIEWLRGPQGAGRQPVEPVEAATLELAADRLSALLSSSKPEAVPEKCPSCDGRGQGVPGWAARHPTVIPCPDCSGSGTAPSSKERATDG